MSTSVYCLTDSASQANDIVHILRDGGFLGDDISVLFPNSIASFYVDHDKGNATALHNIPPMTLNGGVAGGTLGWLTAIGEIDIPSVGRFVAAGPLMSALRSATPDATADVISDCLMSMDLPDYVARHCCIKIIGGQFMVSVMCRNEDRAKDAKKFYGRISAHDIGCSESDHPASDNSAKC